MRYLLLAALVLGACALDPYEAPDGSLWPSMAAHKEATQGTATLTWCFENWNCEPGDPEYVEPPQLKVME